MKKTLFTLIFIITSIALNAQKINLLRIEPMNWWVGMHDTTLQLLVYGENISLTTVNINSKQVKLVKINKAESPNYIFIDLIIPKYAQPETFDIIFKNKNKKIAYYKYQLLQKQAKPQGFSSADVVYLIMSDRFANGDTTNDNDPKMFDYSERNDPNGRHGGDIQGVINHLDYFNKIGVSTIWLTPVIQNNMPEFSYHGYAITDFYTVDSRFGTNELYKTFVQKAHSKNLKIIQDVIYNHCGLNHWWMHDLPFKDWINYDKSHHCSYRGEIISDPYTSDTDMVELSTGWFVDAMPDMNQHNPFLAKYLIQNTLWWIEYANIDGLRIDTYVYPFQDFMTTLTRRVHEEYPTLSMLGETWLQTLPSVAALQMNSKTQSNVSTDLNSITDFPLCFGTTTALNEQGAWDAGMMRIFYILSQDFLYGNPYNLAIFLDNHDLTRFYSAVNQDFNKYKLGLAFLLTSRGIPFIYYGTEIAMSGKKDEGDGFLRKDFPGGWKNDTTNIFTFTNLSPLQSQSYDFTTKIMLWRKNSDAVKFGKLLHFVPQNNVYVYFRYTEKSAVMVILNANSNKQKIDCSRFKEILSKYKTGTEIISDKKFETLNNIEINAMTPMIIDLGK